MSRAKTSSFVAQAVYVASIVVFFLLGYQYGRSSGRETSAQTESGLRTYPVPVLRDEDYRKVLMSREEIDAAIKYLPRNGVYIEWGTGGSTLVFSKFVKKGYSIEHVKPWCERVQKDMVEFNVKNINFHCVPVKKEGGGYLGNENEGSYSKFRVYVDYVDTLGVEAFDAVLIDGRARIAVALKVLPYLKDGSVVFLHDTTQRVQDYSEVLKHYDLIEKVEGKQGLSILKRKKKYSGGKGLPIKEDYIHELYKYLPN